MPGHLHRGWGIFTSFRRPSLRTLNGLNLTFSLRPLCTRDRELLHFLHIVDWRAMSASSISTIHSIIDAALADYTKLTGTDLSKTLFATALEHSNSPEAVLQLLHEREKAFKENRHDDRKLMNCLSPTVKVLLAFSDIVGGAVSQVSHTCHPGLELPNVRLCVASRPEMDIRVILDPLTTLKI